MFFQVSELCVTAEHLLGSEVGFILNECCRALRFGSGLAKETASLGLKAAVCGHSFALPSFAYRGCQWWMQVSCLRCFDGGRSLTQGDTAAGHQELLLVRSRPLVDRCSQLPFLCCELRFSSRGRAGISHFRSSGCLSSWSVTFGSLFLVIQMCSTGTRAFRRGWLHAVLGWD